MGTEGEVVITFFVIGLIFLFAFLLIINVIGAFLMNSKEEAEIQRDYHTNERDSMAITQSKVHHRKVHSDAPKNNADFEVDFNISLKDSIVKTEVVYAE